MTDDEIKSRVIFHIIKQYGTKAEGENLWVLPVIEEEVYRPSVLRPRVMGNVLVLELWESE